MIIVLFQFVHVVFLCCECYFVSCLHSSLSNVTTLVISLHIEHEQVKNKVMLKLCICLFCVKSCESFCVC